MDAIVDQWHRERPDLDAEVMGVVGRLSRAVQLGSGRVEATHRRHGLQRGEFDVLAALRRSGEPFEVTPSSLADTLMLSRAGMTSRVDRLERAGFVQWIADPADRRSLRVALTPTGLELIDTVVADHIATEQQLITPLTTRERAELDLPATQAPDEPGRPRAASNNQLTSAARRPPDGPAEHHTTRPGGNGCQVLTTLGDERHNRHLRLHVAGGEGVAVRVSSVTARRTDVGDAVQAGRCQVVSTGPGGGVSDDAPTRSGVVMRGWGRVRVRR